MDRRRFLCGTAATIAFSDAVAAIPAKVDPTHIRDLRASVDELYTKDQHVGGAALASAALDQYRLARQMLDEADYDELNGQQLMSIAGELAVCIGWLSYDGDDQGRARELYSEAFLLADQAGDTGLTVKAIEKMSLQSTQIASKRGKLGLLGRPSGSVLALSNWHDMIHLHDCAHYWPVGRRSRVQRLAIEMALTPPSYRLNVR